MSAATATPDADRTPDAATDAAGSRSRRSIWATRVVIAWIVVMLVVTAAMGWRAFRAAQVDSARGQALEATRSAVPQVLSYNYQTLNADLDRARTRITGGFASQFDDIATRLVVPTAVQQKVVTSGSVTAASVVTADRRQVTLLAFVNQTTQRAEEAADKDSKDAKDDAATTLLDTSRVEVTMVKRGDRWLISDLRPL